MNNNIRPDNMERITTKELAENFINEQINEIRKQIGNKKVLLALSGGVDSSVVAALLIKAIGKDLQTTVKLPSATTVLMKMARFSWAQELCCQAEPVVRLQILMESILSSLRQMTQSSWSRSWDMPHRRS